MGFYPAGEEEQKPFIETGSLPVDLKPITDEDYFNYFNPPLGYQSVFDEAGPRIESTPEPDYLERAENELKQRLAEVVAVTSILQTKLLMGRKLTDSEILTLNAWMDYSDVLNDTDISDAPDVQWPTKPTE